MGAALLFLLDHTRAEKKKPQGKQAFRQRLGKC